MRADAETARLQEDEEARAQRRAEEDALLERAAEVARARDAAARQLPASQEPKRGKAHWDFVMEEMAWMAKEFQRCGPGLLSVRLRRCARLRHHVHAHSLLGCVL